MIALIRAETARLLARRITLYFPLTLAVLMIVGIVIAILIIQNENDSVDFVADIAGLGEGSAGANGTAVLGPMGFLIPIMAFVIGASYYGADEKSGMIEHLLTWEPQRLKLLLARMIGGGGAIFAISALLSAFLVVLLYILSAVSGGDTSGVGDVAGTILAAILRSGVSGTIFFLFGLGLTVIVNNSVASIVGFLIWVFIVEVALIGPLLPNVAAWFPVSNSDSFVSGMDYEVFPGPFDDGFEPTLHHSALISGVIILAWGAAFNALGAFAFWRRDID
ncbi:MAG: hypothetical protein AAF962_13765 [Actinomycetota bacterium]